MLYRYIPITDQISLSDCLYFLRYLAAVRPLQLFAFQSVTSKNLKLTSAPYQAVLLHNSKSHDKNLNILRTIRTFKMK